MQTNEPQLPFGRTVPPDSARIRQLRINNGWTEEQLARKARCSYKTIENLEDGRSAYVATFKKVADALGVQVQTICCFPAAQEQPPAAAPLPDVVAPPAQRKRKLTVELKGEFQGFDECKDLADFMATLLRLIRPGHEFEVTAIEMGSVLISLAVSDEDAHRIVDALAEGKLEELYGQVASITFDDMDVRRIDASIPIRLYGVNSLASDSQPGGEGEQRGSSTAVATEAAVEVESSTPDASADISDKRRKAEGWVNGYTATAVAAVLGVAWLPGAATGVLCALEATMCYQIGKLYRDSITKKEAAAVAAAIGLAGLTGNILAMEATILLGPLAFVAKPAIAGGIVKAMGQLVIKHFEDSEKPLLRR